MQLIRLSANQSSFHTIEFKPGLNLIVGKQANPSDDNKKNTYNGVGKSLIIYLIHFCLGSNEIKVFAEKMPDWEFTLAFTIGDESFVASRNTSSQNEIFLNEKKYTLPQFRQRLLPKAFHLSKKVSNLTFNTLFPRFIRRDRECYARYDTFIKKEQEYSKLVNNAFLLGLDVDMIEAKKKLRDLYTSTDTLKKGLEKDPILQEHFHNHGNAEIEMLDVDEEISKLDTQLANFKVAHNYQEIEREADEMTYAIKKLENKRTLTNNAIRQIETSLKIEPDVSKEHVIRLYEQAHIQIPDMVNKQVREVIDFHNNLLAKRQERLQRELQRNKTEFDHVTHEIEHNGKRLDELLGYLHTHGALDEYLALSRKLHDLKLRRKGLEEYQDILKTYKKKVRDLQADHAKGNKEAEDYLDSVKDLLNRIMGTFRELSKSFYDKSGGITITNNAGENTLRFDMTAKIQDDSSDGVNEVKIFCFDMTLLLLQQNHNMKFLFHDSRLFSNMDPRQRYTLFKLAFEKATSNHLQYIATVNEDTLSSIQEVMTDDEYTSIIEDNVILTLTDESEQSKLLGIQVDMNYEQ